MNRLGYQSYQYANAFVEFGIPIHISELGTHILCRRVPQTDYYDLTGLYPIMCCDSWENVADRLSQALGAHKFVSFVAVTDPFCGVTDDDLVNYGMDFARVYKQHVIVSPGSPSISDHHAYYADRALKNVEVEVFEGAGSADAYLSDWCVLYANLKGRHNIKGMARFSRMSFEAQFLVPGFVAFRAIDASDGKTVGMHLWYEHDQVAYSHLAASSKKGYDLMASYALHKAAIDFFNGRVGRLDLGAGAGVGEESSGLAWFKRGWSQDTLPVHLCGKVLSPSAYIALSEFFHADDDSFFPSYRSNTRNG